MRSCSNDLESVRINIGVAEGYCKQNELRISNSKFTKFLKCS